MPPGSRRQLVTAALMLGMFLAALEATAVAAAMPTVVGDLGGVARYSWVFSAYLLTSTTVALLYGKLADLYGRRRLYYTAVGLFLLGSGLCGAATSMEQLIAFRAVQGLGAGGVMVVAITLIGDIFTLEERGKMQGLFAGVWGVSSFLGPALGGVVTDLLSWRWVFYLNLPVGLASVVLLALFLDEPEEREERRLDWPGAVLLALSVTTLLFALLEGPEAWGWNDPRTLGLGGAAVVLGVAFLAWERRFPEPVLPPDLLARRLVAVALGSSALVGIVIYTVSAYVPVFGQGVMGGTAIDAGILLAPVSIGWPLASTLAGRLLLVVRYRTLFLVGSLTTLAGTVLLTRVGPESGRWPIMVSMLVVGIGLGFQSTPQTVAIQSAVPWQRRGVATSAIQFFRSIGGAVVVAALGALLNARLDALAGDADTDVLLDPELRADLDPGPLQELAGHLAAGLGSVYLSLAALTLLGVALALAFPAGSARELAHRAEAGAADGGAPREDDTPAR